MGVITLSINPLSSGITGLPAKRPGDHRQVFCGESQHADTDKLALEAIVQKFSTEAEKIEND